MADTPEERVRQALLLKMIGELGFPKGLIAVEKKVGSRRFDLVCYTPEMTPLLLVECKAGELNEVALHQAFGYNETIQAPFLCLANGLEIKTFWQEGKENKVVPFLPAFAELYGVSRRK